MKTFKDNFFENPSCATETTNLAIDYAGVCCPAHEVPGNFIEKHSFPNGKVVFAIGDTGRLPDPLPALCVRHYWRRSLLEGNTDPILAAESMNQLIYDCCAASSSVSCFYAEFSAQTGLLRYVNAGHDAPLLVRANSDQVPRLDQGGPVFGLRESSHYTETVIPLRSGDRLVAFTQGVVDSLAIHPGGAENAIISLARGRSLSAFQLAHRIVAECEATGSGARAEKSVFVACFRSHDPGAGREHPARNAISRHPFNSARSQLVCPTAPARG
jgi:sigma-B regulation protein RsbU (phosphoserine phosphatase)